MNFISSTIYKIVLICLAGFSVLVACQDAALSRQPHLSDVDTQFERLGSQSAPVGAARVRFNSPNIDTDTDGDNDDIDVDDDNDGLIDIWTLEDLDKVRFDLNGDGTHNKGSGSSGHIGAIGAPASGGAEVVCDAPSTPGVWLCGYELMRDLDFDDPASYRSGSVNTAWTGGSGWTPIGDNSTDDDTTRFQRHL